MTSGPNALSEQNAVQDAGLHDKITAIQSLSNQQYYPIDKLDAHVKNIPHLAISIFIFENNKLLLQKRADSKYHSGGLWANSVCSHPRWEESIENCANRRLEEELGWQVQLTKFAEINYQIPVGRLFENEHVHCFYGIHDPLNNIEHFNPTEVAAVQWCTLDDITRGIELNPDQYSEWFKLYINNYRPVFEALMP